MPDPHSEPRFFGRRRGKTLRRAPQALLERLLPALTIAPPPAGCPMDPWALFTPPPARLWLEIGFGGGEHLAWQAGRHPDIGVIGAEVFRNGIAALLTQIEALGLANIRIFPDDVRRLLPALPPACLSRVFLLFPDPWPKSRHAERRFVNPANLDQLALLMAPDAQLRVASDDPTYQHWVPQVMADRADFADVWPHRLDKPEDWPATRYEAKARRAGRVPMFFCYQRRAPIAAQISERRPTPNPP